MDSLVSKEKDSGRKALGLKKERKKIKTYPTKASIEISIVFSDFCLLLDKVIMKIILKVLEIKV